MPAKQKHRLTYADIADAFNSLKHDDLDDPGYAYPNLDAKTKKQNQNLVRRADKLQAELAEAKNSAPS